MQRCIHTERNTRLERTVSFRDKNLPTLPPYLGASIPSVAVGKISSMEDGREWLDRLEAPSTTPSIYIYIYIYSRDREVIRADANGGRRIPSRSSLVRIRLGRGLLCPLITIHLRLWSISRVRRPVSASCSCTVYPRLRHILRSHALRTVILVNTTLFVALSTADYSFPLPAPPLPPSFLPCSLPSSARHFWRFPEPWSPPRLGFLSWVERLSFLLVLLFFFFFPSIRFSRDSNRSRRILPWSLSLSSRAREKQSIYRIVREYSYSFFSLSSGCSYK